MKQFLLKSIFAVFVLLAGVQVNAQNNIDLKWGYFLPVNDHLNQSFSSPRSFSIALMHPIPKSKFEAGIKFSHERYKSKDDLSTQNNSITIHNYLISGRYNLVQKEVYNFFTMADAGINLSNKKEFKNGIISKVDRTGATVCMGIGIDFKIGGRLLLSCNVQTQYAYTDDINFTDKINANHVFSVAANIGMRIQLKSKR